MFTSENVVALFKKGTLKLTQNEDGEYRRMAEATLLIEPFTEAMARELGDEIAGHLFSEDGRIREELESIDLRVRAGLQHVTVRLDEALEPTAILSPASIKDVSCSLCEDKKMGRQWLAFTFVVVFSLEERAARNFVLDEFGKSLLWSFERSQPDLEGLARVKDAGARLAETAARDGGSVTLSTGDMSVTLGKGDAARLRDEAATLRRQKKSDQTAH